MAWARAMVLAPAAAAGAAAGWVGSWETAAAAVAAGYAVARVVAALAANAATAKFLAEAESPVPDVVEVALAARVGLDLGTVIEAKAAVKAAVRQVMVRRGAGIAALVRVPRLAADVAWAREQAATASDAEESSAPGTAAGSGSSAAPEAELSGATAPGGLRAASDVALDAEARARQADAERAGRE